jgi:PAS domain S-box-containing protein
MREFAPAAGRALSTRSKADMTQSAVARKKPDAWNLAARWPDWQSGSNALARYALPVLSVLFAALFLNWMRGLFAVPGVFLIAVVISALFGGWGPGLLATSLATVTFYNFFMPHYFERDALHLPFVIVPRAIGSFGIAALAVTILGGAQRRATRSLRLSNSELDRKVNELEGANRALENENAERKRSEQLRATQYAVTRVLAEADSLAVAGPQVIEAICKHLEWDWAALWTADPRGEQLRCDCISNARGLQTAEFDSASRKMGFVPNQGRVGRIWRSGVPDWFADVTREGVWFKRISEAVTAGLHGSAAVPILLDAHCLGVLEFFSHAPRQRDDDELHALATIGSQLGQFVERKRAEAAVFESERRWRNIFDTAGVGIATSGRDCRFTTANRRFQEMLGYTEEELRGLTPFGIAYEDDRAAAEIVRGEVDAFVGNGDRQNADASVRSAFHQVETRCRRKDGSLIWVNVITSAMPESDDDRFSLAAMIVDITARKRTEEVLEQARAELRRLNRVMLLGEMTASIAHEVNQPISAAITNANAGLRWLDARPPELEEVRQALTRIARDGNRAAAVIDRIRGLTRKRPPHADSLDVNDVVREVIALMHMEIQNASVDCQPSFREPLPDLSLDRVQVQQVFMNLILNAIEAMGAVQDRPRELAVVTGQGDPDHVYVEVRDSGPGFDSESGDRLFQAFYTTKPESMGIGLAICRSIIEAHGGSVTAAPNHPNGAIFRCTLPIGQATPDHQRA